MEKNKFRGASRVRSIDFLGKKFLIVSIYRLNFVIQNTVLRVSRKKNPKSLPVGTFLAATPCIPFRGNFLLREISVCILFISSERIGILSLYFAALIQVSIEIFAQPLSFTQFLYYGECLEISIKPKLFSVP